MNEYHDFLDVDTFTVGAVGQPGARTFFLQAQHAGNRVTVKCEKQQAGAIAEYLRKVLSDLPPGDTAVAPMDLAVPFESAFVLGPVGLGYDRESDRVLVQLEEFAEVDDDGEPIDQKLERLRTQLLTEFDEAHRLETIIRQRLESLTRE